MGEKEMNETENYVKKQYEKQGYTVIRNGVPDFLLIKDGKLSFSEVKTTKDKLSKEQIYCHEILKNITFEVKTDIVKDINPPKYLSDKIMKDIWELFERKELFIGDVWNLASISEKYPASKKWTSILISMGHDMQTWKEDTSKYRRYGFFINK